MHVNSILNQRHLKCVAVRQFGNTGRAWPVVTSLLVWVKGKKCRGYLWEYVFVTRRHYFPDSSCCSCMLKYCNSVTGHWMSILVLLEYFVQHPGKTRYQPRIPHTKSRDYFPRDQCQTIYCFALAISSMRGSRCCCFFNDFIVLFNSHQRISQRVV